MTTHTWYNYLMGISTIYFLEAKASKGIYTRFILKNHLTATYLYIRAKIVPLFVRVYSAGFVKCLDNAIFCSFSEAVRSIMSQRIFFTGLNVFFKALNFRF